MNREAYLKELDRYLRKLPREDYENAMEYFTEYFEEAGPQREAEVIEELGPPREAAAELLNELLTTPNLPVLYQKPEKDKEDREASGDSSPKKADKKKGSFFGESSVGRIILIALLAILAAPVGIPLGITAIALLFSGVAMAAAVFFAVVVFGIGAVLGGGWLVVQSFALFASSLAAGVLVIGSGILGIGLGLLVILFAIWAGKMMIFGLIRLISRMISRKGGEKHE